MQRVNEIETFEKEGGKDYSFSKSEWVSIAQP